VTVEALANAEAAQPGADATNGTAAPANEAALSEDAAMDAVWNRLVTNNGADREGDGKFVSADPEKRAAAAAANEAPLEGGEGGEPEAGASTVPAEVPLPANWVGKDALWAKLPADVRAEIAEHQTAQHVKLSDMGRKVAAYEPLQQAATEFAEYFNGNLNGKDGKPIAPADGVRYLANIQRMMDRDPVNTLVSIIDTYGARAKIAAVLGVKTDGNGTAPATDTNTALLAKIDRLEGALRGIADPSRIEKVVDEKTARARHDEEVSRLTTAKPLYSKIPETRMVFFINEAWAKLGNEASPADVFEQAYNAAIEADPTLRAQSKAAGEAAKDTANKAAGAKAANAVNVRSTAAAKPRPQSEDEAMEEVWRKHNPQG
jgi:hypothetical protein